MRDGVTAALELRPHHGVTNVDAAPTLRAPPRMLGHGPALVCHHVTGATGAWTTSPLRMRTIHNSGDSGVSGDLVDSIDDLGVTRSVLGW
jgi:hypothetical protein